MTSYTDSRFPKDDYERMAAAVEQAQQTRATVAGPPNASAPFGLDGVEKRAKDRLLSQQNQGPMEPMIVNGVRSFAAPAATSAPAAPAVPAATAAPTITGADLASYGIPKNPLGGMSSAPLSTRGGPMSYSQKGVGTTNPNSYAVGQGSRRPTRYLERAARHGDVGAAKALADIGIRTSEGQANRDASKAAADAEFARELQFYGMKQQDQAAADQRRFNQSNELFNKETERRKGESEADWNRRMEETKRQEGRNKGFTVAPIDPNDASKGNAIMRGDGSLFNVLPGQKPEPPPLTPGDLESYGKMFPGAAITGKLPNGAVIQRQPEEPAKPFIREVPGPLIPHPTIPGMMMPGPQIPAQMFPDGTYQVMTPKPAAAAAPAAGGGAGGDSAKDKLNALRAKAGLAAMK